MEVDKIHYDAKYIFHLLKPEKALRHEDLQGAPLLILANKQVSLLDYTKNTKERYSFNPNQEYDKVGRCSTMYGV